ncbi:unnamed protein product [Linum trigynum]|uniref:Uncharacterized protein n=1 Tax=Linum trigynum TaxID=586398 RepID=A0AAV2F712_9ROSI
MFQLFHAKKDKNWVSLKAKELHNGMIEAEAAKVSQGEDLNRFTIIQEVNGAQHPNRVVWIGYGVSSVDVFNPPSSQGCIKCCQEDQTKEREQNDEKMKKLENEIVEVRNAIPQIVEVVLQKLGVRLLESFDMDINTKANREDDRVGETQDNDETGVA